MSMSREVAEVWLFESSSSDAVYETLRYTDGFTSCNCPGWTRRVDAQGNRSCKHTRAVDMGRGEQLCSSYKSYTDKPKPAPTVETATAKPKKGSLAKPSVVRQITFEED